MAPLPAPVVPSNSASFQSCINSTTGSSSQFPPDVSDPSLLTNPVYDQQPGMPVYDYSSFPHPSMPADTKPGWDVLSGASGSSSYPSATATSAQYQQQQQQQQQRGAGSHHGTPRQGVPRGAKRMMTPRLAVSSSHMPDLVCTSLSLCLSVCMSRCLSVPLCLPACLSVCLSVHLCLSVRMMTLFAAHVELVFFSKLYVPVSKNQHFGI